MKEQGYIFKSSEINAENLAASQGSRNSGLTFFIHCTIPDIEQLSKPILTFLHLSAASKNTVTTQHPLWA